MFPGSAASKYTEDGLIESMVTHLVKPFSISDDAFPDMTGHLVRTANGPGMPLSAAVIISKNPTRARSTSVGPPVLVPTAKVPCPLYSSSLEPAGNSHIPGPYGGSNTGNGRRSVGTGANMWRLTSVGNSDQLTLATRSPFHVGGNVEGRHQKILQSPTSNLQALSAMPVKLLLYGVSK